jgi:hypothetical protein
MEDWHIAEQVEAIFRPDTTLIVRVLLEVQQYRRGLVTKDDFLDSLLAIINGEF